VLAIELQLDPVGLIAAAVQRRLARVRVDLQHLAGHPLQKGPVVRDDHQATTECGDVVLEQLKPGYVEVVRRLVEQQHVNPGQQHGAERQPGRLAAGQPCRGPVQVSRQPKIGGQLQGPDLQVGPAQRE
jgi:hypothetical protein